MTDGAWEPTVSSVFSGGNSYLNFDSISAGTNSTALLIGSGGSLNVSGSGTINATSMLGNNWASPAAIGTGIAAPGIFTEVTATSGGIVVGTTTAIDINDNGMFVSFKANTIPITVNDSINFTSPIDLNGNAGALGQVLTSGGNGAIPTWSNLPTYSNSFSNITAGTNIATLLIGTGGSLSVSGTGSITATSLLGNTWSSPQAIGNTSPNSATFTSLTLSGSSAPLILNASAGVAGQIPVSQGAGSTPIWESISGNGLGIVTDGTTITGNGLSGSPVILNLNNSNSWAVSQAFGDGFSSNGTVTMNGSLSVTGTTFSVTCLNIDINDGNHLNLNTASSNGSTSIGSTGSSGTVDVESGSGGITVGTGSGAGGVKVGSTSNTGTVDIESGSGGVTVGTSSGAGNVKIGSSSNTGTVDIESGTGITLNTNSSAGSVKIGGSSVSLGNNAVASGSNSISAGLGSSASGTNASALGYDCSASGMDSFAAVASATASGLGSVAIGIESKATVEYAFAIGYYVTANGYNSFGLGSYVNTNNMEGSIAIGDASTIMNGTDSYLSPSQQNEFVARMAGGYYFYSNAGLTTYIYFPANGGITINNGHVQSLQTTAPTWFMPIGSNAGAGSSASLSHATDVAGLFTITTGIGLGIGIMASVNFNNSYAVAPIVVITPEDQASAALQYYVQSSTTGFTVGFGVLGTATTTYHFYYHVIETQ